PSKKPASGRSGGGNGGGAKRIPTHVACVGDSITAGFGAMTKSYANWLIELLGKDVKVGVFGHAGSCLTSNCKMPTAPYLQQPEYAEGTEWVASAGDGAVVDVIIMLGTNDAAPQNWPDGGKAPAQYAKDYSELIDHFMSLPTHPVVYMVLPPAQYGTDKAMSESLQTGVIPVIKQVAEARGMPLIDVNTPTLNHPDWFPDGLHPNDAGHEVIAKVMHAALLDLPIPTPVPSTGGSSSAGGSGGKGTADGGAGGSSPTGAGGSVGAGSPGVSGAPGSGGQAPMAASQSGGGGCALAGRGSQNAGWLAGGSLAFAWLLRRKERRRTA
ncbi:MAG: hypothetical protein EOO73_32620, partial [Myxococcales bacterium]